MSMADEVNEYQGSDPHPPLPGPPQPLSKDPPELAIVVLNRLLSVWNLPDVGKLLSLIETGPKHATSWTAVCKPSTVLQFLPPAKAVVAPTKKAAKREWCVYILDRVQRADLMGHYIALGLLIPPIFDGDAIFIELVVHQPEAGRALIFNHLCRDEYKQITFEEEVQAFITRNKGYHVGFDAERDTGNNRTTLIQIADEFAVLLFRPSPGCDSLPPCLEQLLTDLEIQKTVVDMTQDNAALKNDFKLACNPMVDLQDITTKFGFGTKPGTKLLASYFLGCDIKKDKNTSKQFSVAVYDKDLTQQQKEYSAEDAIIAYELGAKLREIEEGTPEEKEKKKELWQRRVIVGE